VNPNNIPNPPPVELEKNALAGDSGFVPTSVSVEEKLAALQQDHELLRSQYEGINRLLEAQSQEFRAALEERDAVLNLNKEHTARIAGLELKIQTGLRENRNSEQSQLALKELREQVDSLTERLVHEQDARRRAELALAQAGERFRRTQPAPIPAAAASPSPANTPKADPVSIVAKAPSVSQVGNLSKPGTGTVSNTLRKTVTSMVELIPQFVRRPTDPKMLGELCRQIGIANEETARSGILPLHQLATALRIMLEDFHKTPTLMVQSRLRTLAQAFDLIQQLCQKQISAKLKSLSLPNVFAVDDEGDVLSILGSELESLGMSLSSTTDSNQVLAALQTQRFNLVLLDIGMADYNGLELCARIRKLEGYARTPVVFLTGLTTMDLRDQAIAIGGNDFVGKPFHAAEVGLKAIFWAIRDQL